MQPQQAVQNEGVDKYEQYKGIKLTTGLADAGGGGGLDAAGGGGGAENEESSSHAGVLGFAGGGRGAEGTAGAGVDRIFDSSFRAGEYPEPYNRSDYMLLQM